MCFVVAEMHLPSTRSPFSFTLGSWATIGKVLEALLLVMPTAPQGNRVGSD